MASDVFFIDFRASVNNNLLDRYSDLLMAAGFANIAEAKKMLAIKLHFGEMGNTAYLRSYFIRRAAEEAIKRGAMPFLTDSNTLYVGSRGRAPEHIKTAFLNGFTYMSTSCPVIISDGLRGDTEEILTVPILGENKEFYIGAEITKADGLLVLSHFKGHEQTGFGGSIKNLGMGASSRHGKLSMHSGNVPIIDKDACNGCSSCERWCITEAIRVHGEVAVIDEKLCIGCGQCIVACPSGAVNISWDTSAENLNKSMVEYCYAAASLYPGKALYVNVVNQVSPNCDCWPVADAPIVADIGILASTDAVAVDAAALDLINEAPGLPSTALGGAIEPNTDKFKAIFPHVDSQLQLRHGEAIGLGSREYKLVRLK